MLTLRGILRTRPMVLDHCVPFWGNCVIEMFQERPVDIRRYFGEFWGLSLGTLAQVNQTLRTIAFLFGSQTAL